MAVDCEGYTNQSVYQLMTLVMLAASTLFMLNYYYGLFNRPIFSRTRIWTINVLFVSAGVGIFAYMLAATGLPPGQHCSYLNFFRTDCILFGLTAFVYNSIYCLLLSVSLKWLSVNNKKVPF